MENRPHSRRKAASSGSAGIGRIGKVNGGKKVGGQSSRPSAGSDAPSSGGSGSFGSRRREQSFTPNAYSGGGRRTSGNSLTTGELKKLLPVIVVLVVAFFVIRSCGGITDNLGGGGGLDSIDSLTNLFGSSAWTDGISSSPDYSDSGADNTVSASARERYVTPVGGGEDIVTVMVYMCGTDLESKYGMATSDISEMAKATISDKVNIIVETGGCKQWKTGGISNSVNQIYKIESGKMTTLEEDFGKSSMTDPSNLTRFIDYCEKNYAADRYFLILWDHGGGTLSGYGYDEKNPSSSSMTLEKINKALADAKCKFDIIGFDACLMATLETALVCNEYADYMIASEEVEPGTGWYYTPWVNALSKNTSIPTVELAETLIDGYMSSCKGSAVTLSVVDLAELAGTVPEAFTDFARSTTAMIENDYAKVSRARANVRQFSSGSKINQVDLCDLANRLGTSDAKALAEAIRGCVKYNGSTISGANGLSIYFPYESLGNMNSAVSVYNSLGMDEEYVKCIKSFASIESAGQTVASSTLPSSLGGSLGSILELVADGSSSSSASPLSALLGGVLGGSTSSSSSSGLSVGTVLNLLSAFSGRSMPDALSWVDTELVASQAERISERYIDPARITLTEKGDGVVLKLTEDEWSLIQTAELNVFVDDGEGFIDLGLDNVAAFDSDGDMIIDYDGTWLALDGHVAAYYLVSDSDNGDGTYTTVGRIPALLNDQLVNIKVVFDTAHPYGVITGAEPMYDGETDTAAKGDIPIIAGDSVALVADYYGRDGEFESAYTISEAFTVGYGGLRLETCDLLLSDGEGCSVSFRLTDVYGNVYWTPAVEYGY